MKTGAACRIKDDTVGVIGVFYVLSGWAASLGYGSNHVNAFVSDGSPWVTLTTRYWVSGAVWIVSLTALNSILRAAATLRSSGVEVKQINAPGNTSSFNTPMLAQFGATHVEPGHGLLRTTPNHAFNGTLPERPAYVYVSEISHHVGARAYAYGGGLFHDGYIPGSKVGALVGSSWSEAADNGVEYLQDIKQIIDYHVVLQPGSKCKVGDTALLGYRTQMQMTQSYVGLVTGLSGKHEITLRYLFDHASTALDEHYDPVDPEIVRRDIEQLVALYM